jgi:hypothetical protein
MMIQVAMRHYSYSIHSGIARISSLPDFFSRFVCHKVSGQPRFNDLISCRFDFPSPD